MIIIPARIGSSRFPNKVLADIGGMPMVIRTAKAVEAIDSVVIATDSEEVLQIASEYGIQAVLTSSAHQSGTDRIYEAVQILGLDEDEIIINVQADEPFIETSVVRAIYDLSLKNKDNDSIMMNTCYKLISNPEADDPNIVKVVTSSDTYALYFSRAKIPYPRDHHFNTYKGHLGIYGFTVKSLRSFCTFAPAALEEIEKLEQLRALYYGYKIVMTEVQTESFGIDTVEDLEKAIRHHRL
jgi:3-deoxy-manno-octulosonate cytidylyltransferase (CMP-KDO synthetase)